MTTMFARRRRCRSRLALTRTIIIIAAFSSLPVPSLGDTQAPAPSMEESFVAQALKEAPLPAQAPSASPPPALAPTSNGTETGDGGGGDDDEKHVAIVHEAEALHDAILDPEACVIEIGTRQKNGLAVREGEIKRGREEGRI